MEETKFDWAFEVIKYWLFEFAYAHHLCNQEKSNLDITDKKGMNRYYNDIKKRWLRTGNVIKDTIDKKEGEYVFGGSRDRKATINAYFKKKEVGLKKNLNDRFDYTKHIIRQIGLKYLDITKVDITEKYIDKKIEKISEIALMRSVMLSAKWYKSQVKAKGLDNIKGSRSKSRSKSPGVKASSSLSYGKKAKPVTQKAKPKGKAKGKAKEKTRKLVEGQTKLKIKSVDDPTIVGITKIPIGTRGTMDDFVTITGTNMLPVASDTSSSRRAQRSQQREENKKKNKSSSNRGLKKGGRKTRKNKRRKTKRKRIYRRRMTMKRRKN